MLGLESDLMEMTDGQEVWAQMETHSGSAGLDLNPAGPRLVTLHTTPHPIDLTTSSEHHYVENFGYKTPLSHGEVPDFVLARVRDEEGPARPEKYPASAVKVCLERRFNAMTPETTKLEDFHSAVLNNLMSKLQNSTKLRKKVAHPGNHKFLKSDKENVFEASNSREGVFNPVLGTCAQIYTVEPNTHQGPSLYPHGLAFNLYQERVHAQTHNTSCSNMRQGNADCYISELTNAVKASQVSAGPSQQGGGKKKPRSGLSVNQRREKHNNKERERRRNIRLCCDKLNTLVPFCDSDTDKVTTLQWTTAFLEYINGIYGDAFKEEFKKLASKKMSCHASSCPAHQNPNKGEVENKLRVEQ